MLRKPSLNALALLSFVGDWRHKERWLGGTAVQAQQAATLAQVGMIVTSSGGAAHSAAGGLAGAREPESPVAASSGDRIVDEVQVLLYRSADADVVASDVEVRLPLSSTSTNSSATTQHSEANRFSTAETARYGNHHRTDPARPRAFQAFASGAEQRRWP